MNKILFQVYLISYYLALLIRFVSLLKKVKPIFLRRKLFIPETLEVKKF